MGMVDVGMQNIIINYVICIDMKACYPASMQSMGECNPWFKRLGHPTHQLERVSVNGKLLKDDITGFAQIISQTSIQ
jgi:hypothetical protein